jgi:HSP20 family protein
MTKKQGSAGRDIGFGRVFKRSADLTEKLGDLAEKGEHLKQSGKIHHQDVEGTYGFSVKVRLAKGDKEVKVEPFGNVRKDIPSGDTIIQEIRELVVDVFEEKDHTQVVAEMPGVSTKDVSLSVNDDLLTIYAEKRDKKCRKEVLLPRNYPLEKMKMSCNNGILEIKCVM